MEIHKSSEYNEKYDYLFKIVLVGDSGVGKTNFLSQLTRQEFSRTTPPTIGVEFTTITFKIGKDLVKTQIWDTAGQERYRAITSAYYRGTYGAIIVYDIERRNTLTQSINHWLYQLRQHSNESTTIALLGNKKDLEKTREVSEREGKKTAEENNLLFFEASALSGENVKYAFFELVKSIYEKNRISAVTNAKNMPDFKQDRKSKIKLKKKGGCC